MAGARARGNALMVARGRSSSPPRPARARRGPALEHARELLKAGAVRRVAVVCPTTPLTRQWARAAARLGVHLVPDASELRPPRDFSGVAVTYARVASVAERWAGQCGGATLVIADEAHHLGEELAWGEGFARAFGATPRWLLLSGTPFRSDQCPIPGVRYDDGVADARRLLQLRRRRPRRHLPPGHLRPLRRRAAVAQRRRPRRVVLRRRGHRARGGPALPHGDLPRAGRRPAAHPRRRRTSASRRSAPAATATRAGSSSPPTASTRARWRACCARSTGHKPTVVLHTEARAAEKLQAFTRSTDRWLVAVNMVSEGVDIPRLRVGVYATAAKTPLVFRQIVGRFVRTLPGRPARAAAGSSCPPTRSCARTPPRSSASCATSCARRARRTRLRLDELDERRATERGEAEAFVPVAADVAPQLALFAGSPGARAGAVVPVCGRRARRGDDAGLRAPRAAARQAPPTGGRPAPQPGRQPRRDQPLAEPLVRACAASRTPRSSSSSARSSCSSAVSPADGESPEPNGVGRGSCPRKR